MQSKEKIIVIVGPTASGKSDLAIKLVLWLRKQTKHSERSEELPSDGEIISADSRQVYKGMDIGTGKVTKKEQKLAKHHLIDVASPKNIFTADDFKKLGQKALSDIARRTKVPIVVGGTGFYIDVLLGRMQVAEVPPNPKLRAQLDKLTVEHLFKMIQKLDPECAKTIESKNKRRLIRALEIIAAIGKIPKFKFRTYEVQNYKILWLGLKPKNLEKRIKIRLEKRLKQGMIKEVEILHKNSVSWKRLHDFGLEYRWISRYLRKEIDYKEMKEGLLRDIVRYSKRQMTWFKKNKNIHWIKNQKQAFTLVRNFLS